ncbi:MAG: tRNA glutamyl-Q(34) synthetase GluQRS [Burkholderiaceae bacterium]|jgi:glutamyl-Q tRNA(Asp) synthetase|nr:tRNA glutamyl-Q(34) synthetase GluQRS [Burkholderiaceae bacterium]
MYIGRFAPSPTGPLHAGSLVAALASWLDARASGGRWLVRMENVDTPRCTTDCGQHILRQLAACALTPDAPVLWQSQRAAHYQRALQTLIHSSCAYPCACSRQDIETAHAALGHQRTRGAAWPYPGTCRPERGGLRGRPARAWRYRVPDTARATITWRDRRLGAQTQNVAEQVGDFVLRRADALWAYQLAVVVDDAAQGITHVVRGADLADNTPRQILLQQSLRLATPQYLHVPLILAADGAKLSKQNGAAPLDLRDPVAALAQAARALGLQTGAPASTSLPDALAQWTAEWAARFIR